MPKKGENIYQRKDGRWEGRYCDGKKLNGKKKYVSIYGHSYKEVKTKLNEKKAAAAAASDHINAKLHEVASKWLEHVGLHVKNSTFTNYSYLLNKHILPLLGDIRIKELDSAVINNFIDKKLKNGRLKRSGGLSKKYLQDILAIVKAIAKYAEQEYGIQNKIRNTTKLRIEKREMRTLNEEDEKRLTKKLIKNPTPYNIGILLALYTGIRIGEVCGLRWEDFDENEKTIRIRRTVQRIRDNSGGTHLSIDKPKTA
ncbi:MAG: tyrosine-type recombinase/integrase, partial [Candidatus Ornithomonoglobus sp.]